MRIVSWSICMPFILGILFYKVSADELDSPKAVRIITPVNHTFLLELNELKPILENDNIKDRHVVVVSIAGAFRQGKSFLLNFFVKYLQAQYKSHNVSDWLGEHETNSQVNGFKFRAGQKRETIGIWTWSEVFTHDFANGEKVAIILVDTQGIFDSKSSVRDYTTIFALTMMLSSVQCYNLMQNVKEDDLQHLELFTEYGRLALQHTDEKPFQKLLFIVRDWPYAFETPYGWDGHKVIDDFLSENEDQTPEMRMLRTRVKVSFEQIQAFLMPHPGFIVAHGSNFTGDLRQISSDFIKYAKDLVPALFAPENLIVKRINGEKVRARDLIQYLESYMNIFNGDTLPEAKTVLRATAEVSYQILYTDYLNHYINTMQRSINEVQSYLSDTALLELHNNIKRESLAKFLAKPKLGGDDLASTFQNKIESSTEEKFGSFKAENERKRSEFIQKANIHNEIRIGEIFEAAKMKVQSHTENSSSDLKIPDLSNAFNAAKHVALEEFDRSKMGDGDISNSFRGRLDQNLNNFQSALIGTLEIFNQRQNHFTNSMQSSLDRVEYFRSDEFVNLHQRVKNEAMSQFLEVSHLDGALKYIIQNKLNQNIDEKIRFFEGMNTAKHTNFVTGGELIKTEVVAFRWPVATASCQTGQKMMSGGGDCRSQDGRGWTFLAGSHPISDSQYTVRCDTPERQNIIASAYVVCK
ncbi:atlastin-like [Sitodiplosis mosellana]|uniref:atlastin-like n=1 Tax=Sitodiplosis mosellana TaxID=263140 RepID=UPI0024451DF6|nr:atlastin-like [Sitodiplosis mosellana]